VRSVALVLAIATLSLVLADCGGGSGGGSLTGSAVSPIAPNAPGNTVSMSNGSAVITIPNRTVSTSARKRNALYVSPSSASIGIAVNGGTPVYSSVASTSSLCTPVTNGRTCTIPVYGPPGADTFVLNVYDGANGAGNLLETGTASTTVASGGTFSLSVTLQGVPASIALVPDTGATITSTGVNAYSLDKCFAAQNVDIDALDADGNTILGAGAPTPALVSSDTTRIAITAPTVSAPNTFGLTRPTIGTGSLTLTATMTPGIGTPLTQALTVTFPASTTICGYYSEYSIPSNPSEITALAIGPDGNVWFTEIGTGKIGTITASGTVTEYPTTLSGYGLVSYQNALWVTQHNQICEFSLTTHTCTTNYPIATGLESGSTIAVGADGALWFDEVPDYTTYKIGRLNTTSGVATDYTVPVSNGNAVGMVADPTGAPYVWFCVSNANEFYKVSTNALTLGAFSGPYVIPAVNGVNVQGMAAGPDQRIWYTEYDFDNADNESHIGAITPSSGTIARYAITSGSGPVSITTGPDGAMWYTGYPGLASIATSGTFGNHFAAPSAIATQPYPIVTGNDGSLWYGDNTLGKIGRLQ